MEKILSGLRATRSNRYWYYIHADGELVRIKVHCPVWGNYGHYVSVHAHTIYNADRIEVAHDYRLEFEYYGDILEDEKGPYIKLGKGVIKARSMGREGKNWNKKKEVKT